ncbi:MAG: Methyltransferase type 11 [Parcubacteria group bacterium]|nr:Methyltransferase type 11 [Parcubacteria group bacterium]
MAYIYQPERALLQEQVARFASYINGKVLDVGGGGFNRYKSLFKYDSFVSLDIESGPGVDVVGSADDLPFKDGEFDSLVSMQVFEHLKYPEKAAQEMARVLAPGGNVLITVPQWNELHSEPHDYWRYTNYGLQELFERNGFALVKIEQRGGYHLMRLQMKVRFLIDSLKLHERPLLAKPYALLFRIEGKIALYRDEHDMSAANRKHAIGWCAVFRKLP